MNPSKELLRKQAREIRSKENVSRETFEAACALFFSQIPLKGSEIIAGYWPAGREFDVRPILREALARGHECALPVISEGSRVLSFQEWQENTPLMEGPHGIHAPKGGVKISPDIIIVPLLAFDESGNRLGQGGGYYDATLAVLRAEKEITAVGLAYDSQACLSGLPCEDNDEKLDMVVTEKQVLDFRN